VYTTIGAKALAVECKVEQGRPAANKATIEPRELGYVHKLHSTLYLLLSMRAS
jgi:hypothetical protein